jgi:hypothetical protein
VDVNRARFAARRSRTRYASAAASHPKNALARRNRSLYSERHEAFGVKEFKKEK